MTMHIFNKLLLNTHKEIKLPTCPEQVETNVAYARRMEGLSSVPLGLSPGEVAKVVNYFTDPDHPGSLFCRAALVIGTRYGNAFVYQKGVKGGGIGYAVPELVRPMIKGLEDTSVAKLDLVAGSTRYNALTNTGVPNIGQRIERLVENIFAAHAIKRKA